MAVNFGRRSRFYSSIFVRILHERQPVYSSCLWDPVYCRNLHTTESACGGRLKSEWRRKRVPALTRLSPEQAEKLKTRKAFGGGQKTKITRAKEGTYIWKSQDIELKTPILDVLYNTAHKDFTERKIMVRGTVVEVAGEPFKAWYEDPSNKSNDIKTDHEKEPLIDERIMQQLQSGKVLAKVSSRPGQEGKVNGYLLEGQELDAYLDETRTDHDHGNL